MRKSQMKSPNHRSMLNKTQNLEVELKELMKDDHLKDQQFSTNSDKFTHVGNEEELTPVPESLRTKTTNNVNDPTITQSFISSRSKLAHYDQRELKIQELLSTHMRIQSGAFSEDTPVMIHRSSMVKKSNSIVLPRALESEGEEKAVKEFKLDGDGLQEEDVLLKSRSLTSKWSSEESQNWASQVGAKQDDANSSKSKSVVPFPDLELGDADMRLLANERMFSSSSENTGIQDYYPSEQFSRQGKSSIIRRAPPLKTGAWIHYNIISEQTSSASTPIRSVGTSQAANHEYSGSSCSALPSNTSM